MNKPRLEHLVSLWSLEFRPLKKSFAGLDFVTGASYSGGHVSSLPATVEIHYSRNTLSDCLKITGMTGPLSISTWHVTLVIYTQL